MTTVADALRAGAALVRVRGHVRRMHNGPNGEVCMAEALSQAGASDLTTIDVMDEYVTSALGYQRQVFDIFDERWRPSVSVEWQNEAARDGEEVAVVMEKAAAWWEEQGN